MALDTHENVNLGVPILLCSEGKVVSLSLIVKFYIEDTVTPIREPVVLATKKLSRASVLASVASVLVC